MRHLLLAACFVVSVVIIANTASNLAEARNPKLALDINFLNDEARLSLAVANLETGSPTGLATAEKLLQPAQNISPADARFLSLIGISHDLAGKPNAAQDYYSKALALLPTEIQALYRTFRHNVTSGRLNEAVDHAEILARRWGDEFSIIGPFLPLLVSNDDARKTLADRFAGIFRGPSLLVLELLNNNEPDAAFLLMNEWMERDDKRTFRPLANLVVTQLIKQQRFRTAYYLFRNSLTEEEENRAGYIHNGEFHSPVTGSLFDWVIKSQPGVSIEFKADTATSNSNGAPATGEGGLDIVFHDAPVQFSNISQNLFLIPGTYQLDINYSATKLDMPKPILLTLDCVDNARNYLQIPLEKGTFNNRNAVARFTVSHNECALQRLKFSNGTMAKSWRNRYSGRLHLNSLKLEITGS